MLYLIQDSNNFTGEVRTMSAREYDADRVVDLVLSDRARAIKEMLHVASQVATYAEFETTMDRSMEIGVYIDYHQMEVTVTTSLGNHEIRLVPAEEADEADAGLDGDETSVRVSADNGDVQVQAVGRCGNCGHGAYNHETDENWCGVCDDECIFQAEGLGASLR